MEEIVERMKKIPPQKYGEIVEAMDRGEWPEVLGEPVEGWEIECSGPQPNRSRITYTAALYMSISSTLKMARSDKETFGLNDAQYLIVQNAQMQNNLLQYLSTGQGDNRNQQGKNAYKQNSKVQVLTAFLGGALLLESFVLLLLCTLG